MSGASVSSDVTPNTSSSNDCQQSVTTPPSLRGSSLGPTPRFMRPKRPHNRQSEPTFHGPTLPRMGGRPPAVVPINAGPPAMEMVPPTMGPPPTEMTLPIGPAPPLCPPPMGMCPLPPPPLPPPGMPIPTPEEFMAMAQGVPLPAPVVTTPLEYLAAPPPPPPPEAVPPPPPPQSIPLPSDSAVSTPAGDTPSEQTEGQSMSKQPVAEVIEQSAKPEKPKYVPPQKRRHTGGGVFGGVGGFGGAQSRHPHKRIDLTPKQGPYCYLWF